jgi:hypothetical protein
MRVALSRAVRLPIVRTAVDGSDEYFSPLLTVNGGQSASNTVYSVSTRAVAWVANIPGQSYAVRSADFSALGGQASSTYARQIVQVPSSGSIEGISYSPEGDALVAAICWSGCSGNARGPDLYVLDTRSGQVRRQLTNSGAGGVRNYSPKWCPRGDWIAFTSTTGGEDGIWLIKPDGGAAAMRVDTGSMKSYSPSWPTEGSRIAFTGVTEGNSDVWVIDGIIRSQ